MHSIGLYITSFVVFASRIATAVELSVDECLAKGYRKSELSCLKCTDLAKFDLFELQNSCLKCCRKDATEDSVKKYHSARFEVCNCNLGHFPQIGAFINGDKMKKFQNLGVKYVRGTPPVLKLLDSSGDVVDELNIQKWDTDTIEEFLSQHLM